MQQKQPLVSIAVVTYNSGKTVLDTLESIAAQTYQNIELIISDDCSKDDTVAICRAWLDSHGSRFARTELLQAEVNRGVCVNANKGRFAATGEWQMGLAGDDILLPNCLSDNMDYVEKHPDSSIIFSYMKIYNEEFREENCINDKKGPKDRLEEDVHSSIYTASPSVTIHYKSRVVLSSFRHISTCQKKAVLLP